jgi:hypothetical protein
MQPQPLICVSDVEASSRFYERLPGGPNHWELWLLDPDGYTVVLASPDGTAGP